MTTAQVIKARKVREGEKLTIGKLQKKKLRDLD